MRRRRCVAWRVWIVANGSSVMCVAEVLEHPRAGVDAIGDEDVDPSAGASSGTL
jgi:hypothetical protein